MAADPWLAGLSDGYLLHWRFVQSVCVHAETATFSTVNQLWRYSHQSVKRRRKRDRHDCGQLTRMQLALGTDFSLKGLIHYVNYVNVIVSYIWLLYIHIFILATPSVFHFGLNMTADHDRIEWLDTAIQRGLVESYRVHTKPNHWFQKLTKYY